MREVLPPLSCESLEPVHNLAEAGIFLHFESENLGDRESRDHEAAETPHGPG